MLLNNTRIPAVKIETLSPKQKGVNINTKFATMFFRWPTVILLAVALLAIGGCAAAGPEHVHTLTAPGLVSADVSPVAVVVVDNTDPQRYRSAVTKEGTLGEVATRFSLALAAKGYTVAPGSAVAMAGAQINLDNSLDNSGVVQVGQAAHVPAVLLVRITQYSRSDQPAPAATTPPPSAGYLPGNSPAPDRAHDEADFRKQYQVTAAVTVRLISVHKGEVLWTGWDSHSSDHLEGDEDGGVLNLTCDDIGQVLPVRPLVQPAATGPANPR